jgi:hypothetical protein
VLLAIDSVDGFLGMLKHNKEQATQKAMFMTSIHFLSSPKPDIGFLPSKDQISKSLKDMQEGIINTINAVPRLLYNRGFKPFFEGQGVTGPNAEKIVVESAEYIDIVGGTDEQLDTDFSEGRAQAEDYEQYREVAIFGETWDYQEYMNTGPTPADMHRVMKDLKTWDSNIKDKMRKQKIVGMLHVDGKKLQSTLVPITELTGEHARLPQAAGTREMRVAPRTVQRQRQAACRPSHPSGSVLVILCEQGDDQGAKPDHGQGEGRGRPHVCTDGRLQGQDGGQGSGQPRGLAEGG